MPRALIFGMQHHLIVLYQVYLNFGPETENSPHNEGHIIYIDRYRSYKIILICDHKA